MEKNKPNINKHRQTQLFAVQKLIDSNTLSSSATKKRKQLYVYTCNKSLLPNSGSFFPPPYCRETLAIFKYYFNKHNKHPAATTKCLI